MVLITRAAAAALMLALATGSAESQARGRGARAGFPAGSADSVFRAVDTLLQRLYSRSRPLLFGFALECVDCQPGVGARGRGFVGAPVIWRYTKYPRVVAVAPGSAAEQAGIREGDVLTTIDDLSLLTDAGAERFARAAAGETVRLVFERDSKSVNVALTLGTTGRGRWNAPGPVRVNDGYMALEGTLNGNVKMEIWSDDPIITQDSANVVTLRIGSRTVIKMQLKKN